MAGEGIITVTGNVGSDAVMHETANGMKVASFSLANTPRIKRNNEWTDGETVWFRCGIWGKGADTAVAEITKGKRVIVTGRFSANAYTDKEGASRLSLDISVDDYGIKPKNVNADVTQSDNISDDPWA